MVLPSKKVISLFGACAIAVGSISFASVYSSKINDQNKPTNLIAGDISAIQNKILEKDTDGDGLKDWEESLWKTSPTMSDTDGDGTSDGEEVRLQRNPIQAGTDTIATTATSTATTTPVDNSITARFGTDFFEQYMKLKQGNTEISPEQESQLIEQILTSYEGSYADQVKFSARDITVIDDSAVAVKAYGNAVGTTFTRNRINRLDGEIINNELYLSRLATETQDPQYLQKIGTIRDLYKNIVAELKVTKVPYSMTSTHIDLMNGFSAAIAADEAMMKQFEDPAAAIFGIKSYLETSQNITTALQSVSAGFLKFGVTYRQDEPGFNIAQGTY